jgi:hypothetical protein
VKNVYKTADLLRECGYDGVEWTAHPGGFIYPAKATPAEFKRFRGAAADIKADNLVVLFIRGDDPGRKNSL